MGISIDRVLIYALPLIALTFLWAGENGPNYPYPAHIRYHGSISPSGYSQRELDRKTLEYYLGWKKRYLVKDGSDYRVAMDINDKKFSTSESIGYGMIVAVMFAGADKEAKKIFDGLYRFSRKHPSSICRDLMSWRVPEKTGDSDSAFDGDADIAYALLAADRQWGSMGDIDYKKEASRILDAVYRCTIGKESHLPLLGDWVDENGKRYNQFTVRSSDFMFSNFRSFYLSTGNRVWLRVIDSCHKALSDIQNNPSTPTPLVPDFIRFDKESGRYLPTERKFLENEDDSYYYNACRVPLRAGMDAILNGDKRSRTAAIRVAGWIALSSKWNADRIGSGYRLDGSSIGNYFSSAFAAPLAVAAKCDRSLQPLLDQIYRKIDGRYENYYEDTLSLISQLLISDNFWDYSVTK